jgi:hypothetical protein
MLRLSASMQRRVQCACLIYVSLMLGGAPAADVSDVETKTTDSFTTGSSDVVINYIDQQISQGWSDNEVQPSPLATDAEWIRRVYLDIVGRIPSAVEVTAFMSDKDKSRRSKMIDQLLDDSAYVRNWTTIWTNLAIGRRTPRRVSRLGMEKFFREAFARNRPWDEVVVDIVTGEGHFVENGQVNFLLAQMANRDDAVQLTAKTTRLFLGMQVQCTQCHNHPFNKWKQDQFWQFNSFFRQTDKKDRRKYDPKSGRMVDDYSEITWKNFQGPVFFEKRSGLMQVAYPEYLGAKVDPGPETDRRKELGRLMTETSDHEIPMIAKAMVNRMWGHFFGYGFTRPIDDLGPHNAASHPELMDRLSTEFVKSGYDLKQLVRWICNSHSYNLTSEFGSNNNFDDPAAGEMPLFSHMYVKSMSAEQLYDSLIVATNAHNSGRSNWEDAEKQRQRWMQQFVVAFDTDENDESTTFNGTIPQALMMMNGELIDNAINAKKGSYLYSILSERGADARKIQNLYLTALSRPATRSEINTAGKLLASYPRDKQIAAYQDLFWALLNSNEFIFNH